MPFEDVLSGNFVHPRIPLDVQQQYRDAGHWTGETLAHIVEAWAHRDPSRIAVVGDRVLAYGEVWDMARRIAGGLQRDGARPGEYFLAVLDNSWQGLLLEVAASITGVVFVPRSPHISPTLVDNLVAQLDIQGAVLAGRLLEKPDWAEVAGRLADSFEGRPFWRQGNAPDGTALADAPQLEDLGENGPTTERVDVDPAAPSLVLATGGTTGTPKSILHGSEALIYAAREFGKAVHYTETDVSVAFAPYGHAGGSIFDIYMPLLHGARVLPLDRWKVEEVGPLIEKWGGTFFVTMGTHFYDLMQQPAEFDRHLASVRLATTGAGPDSLFVSAQERYDFTLVRVYGCGEAPGHAIGRPDDPADARLLEDGVPFPGVEVRIVGMDGEPVDAGKVGEYECRGPNLFMGYVGQDDLTAEAITLDGFYRSGDLMRLGETGYISWSGRSKEIIRRGGLQIDPVEIESMLSNHPQVETVVVVGKPDDRLGERAVIIAVPSAGASLDLDDLTKFLLDQGLPKNCLPEALYEVPEVPRTELGKFHRARVRSELVAGEYDRGVHV